MTQGADRPFLQQMSDEINKRHLDPFSDESGWATPQIITELLTEVADPKTSDRDNSTCRTELEIRVQMHIFTKSQQLQQAIADRAEQTASGLKRATWALALSTVTLAIATVVLVIVTATH
jgi:hypothetical protein